ncbi:hypothetical protein pb186bvf_020879 [Paramecium bursaria]
MLIIIQFQDLQKQDAFFGQNRYVQVNNNKQGRINIDFYPRETFPDSIAYDQFYIYPQLRLKIDYLKEFKMNFKYGPR